MTDLITRLEGLSEPCRKCDMLIYCDVAKSNFEYHGGDCVMAVSGGFSARMEVDDVPNYTSSIDAALTLVPEAMVWAVHKNGYCQIQDLAITDEIRGKEFTAIHKFGSPAIAICIASLRARKQ